MKKVLLFFALFMGLFATSWAYDFSAISPSGHTLFYNIISGGVEVINQNEYIYYTNPPTGALIIPSSVVYNGNTYSVIRIGGGAFIYCFDLTSVTIPNSVTSIGSYAFEGCISLTSVTIPNSVTSIGSYAFEGCSSLASVSISNSVTSIGSYAFKYCSSLTSVTIPNSVTSIDSGAFIYCSGLTSVTIPNSVTSIGFSAFTYCSSLASVSIPNSVTSIGIGAFEDCSSLTSVTIPNSVTSINSNTFARCSNLASVSIPNSVTSIGIGAFKGCSGLSSVTIPNAVKIIGEKAFYGCSNLATVNYYADSCTYAGYESGNSLYLPFGSSCTGLTTVNVGANVKVLPDYLFAYCRNLANVNLPNTLKYIGKYTLSNTSINTITIPNSVNRISDAAFWRCYNLTNVTLPNTLSEIGSAAFQDDTNLVSINIPTSLTHIRKNLFRRCYNLPSIDLSHVIKVDSTAFIACRNITSLTIPSNITDIAYGAFASCTGLTEITFESRIPPTIGDSAFINVPSSTPVYIPCGTLALYAARLPYLSNFVENTFTFSAVSEDDNKGTVQVLNEPTCTNPNAVLNAIPASGYRFDHWRTGSTQNPYSLTVTTDTVITAYFVSEGGTEGIEDINADGVNINVKDGRIVVDGTTEEYRIYDITGRIVVHGRGSEVASLLPCGVYLVKVGLRPARKVVIL